MAIWAYPCRPCDGGETWFVDRDRIDAMPPQVRILRVRSGSDWRCAVVDRSRAVPTEGLLIRDAVASDAADCPGCAEAPGPQEAQEAQAQGLVRSDAPGRVQAAAISIAGRRMVVVLVGGDLLARPGEADMLAADLRVRFGGVDIVLVAQDDDGAPRYRGEPALLEGLSGVPLERMPWKAYPV